MIDVPVNKSSVMSGIFLCWTSTNERIRLSVLLFCCCLFKIYRCSNCLWGLFVFGPGFVMQYFGVFLVLQSFRCGRESWLLYFIVFWMSCRCYRSLPCPHGVMGWSVVYDCGSSWSYSPIVCSRKLHYPKNRKVIFLHTITWIRWELGL